MFKPLNCTSNSGQGHISAHYKNHSGDSWMYPYQRTPMGNPYISPIYPYNTWVFMGYYPQESLYFRPISTMGTLWGVYPIVPWIMVPFFLRQGNKYHKAGLSIEALLPSMVDWRTWVLQPRWPKAPRCLKMNIAPIYHVFSMFTYIFLHF